MPVKSYIPLRSFVLRRGRGNQLIVASTFKKPRGPPSLSLSFVDLHRTRFSALEGWDQQDEVGWMGLKLDQSYVDTSLIPASRRFLAKSRWCASRLQTVETNDAIENLLQVMQQWQGRISGAPATTADGEQ